MRQIPHGQEAQSGGEGDKLHCYERPTPQKRGSVDDSCQGIREGFMEEVAFTRDGGRKRVGRNSD